MLRFLSVPNDKQETAGALEIELGKASALAHSAMARVAAAAAEFDELGGWCDPGFRSFDHWLAVEMGFDPHTGKELLRVGKALPELPKIAAAFEAGQLSFDKVREVTTVATPKTEEFLLGIARGASASQLARICRAIRKMTAAESQQQQAKRGLWMHLDDDGMVRLVANLTAEEGAIVKAAIESLTETMPLPEDAEEPAAARRVDALVVACQSGAPDMQLVVHVDIDSEAARRLGCGAEIVPVIERNGLPIDVGRKYRTAPPKLRMALEIRDRFCRFPGCTVPAEHTDAHHLTPWIQGGGTNFAEMVLLCRYHHRIYHQGGYRIVQKGRDIGFETSDGQAIGVPGQWVPAEVGDLPADAGRAEWGGARIDWDDMMFVLGLDFGPAEPRAGPN